MPSIELEMRGMARDAIVVTTMQGVAEYAREHGRRALLHGRDWRDWRDLRDRWSELSNRIGIAQVIGPEWLCDAVTHFCQITATNRRAGICRARRWAEHTIRNLMLLAEVPHAMRYDGAKGRPCIIVGAGPSLDKNGYLLRGAVHSTNAIVIGVNAASLAVPCDATLSVESNLIRQKLSPRGMQLLALAAPPELLQERKEQLRPIWNGEIAWAAEELTGIDRLPTSGSASTSAISLAHLWGCDPIVLVGQDMAYPEGKVYASSTSFGDDRIDLQGKFHWGSSEHVPRPGNPLPEEEQLEMVPNWAGDGMVASGLTFKALRFWLGAAAETFGEDARLINATEGGSAIPGWEPVKLETVLTSLPRGPGPALELGAPQCSREQVKRWLELNAHKLAEAWAYGAIDERVQKHRERAPYRVPFIEAFAVRRAVRDVEGIVEDAEREIRCLVRGL